MMASDVRWSSLVVRNFFFLETIMKTAFNSTRDNHGRLVHTRVVRGGLRLSIWRKEFGSRYFFITEINREPIAVAVSRKDAERLLAASK